MPACNCSPPPRLLEVINQISKCFMSPPPTYPKEGSLEETCNIKGRMEKVGAEFIGAGISRDAFGFENDGCRCIIKVASHPANIYQNVDEVKTWRTIPDHLRDLLVPVEFWDDKDWLWLTMPRVKVNEISEEERMRIAEELRDTLRSREAACIDINFNNVGLTQDNREVLVNYGFAVVSKCPIQE